MLILKLIIYSEMLCQIFIIFLVLDSSNVRCPNYGPFAARDMTRKINKYMLTNDNRHGPQDLLKKR